MNTDYARLQAQRELRRVERQRLEEQERRMKGEPVERARCSVCGSPLRGARARPEFGFTTCKGCE